MAKVMTAKVKLQCPGGQATPAPPVGPALGQHGVNIGQFVMQFNERSKEMKGTIIPVEITIYSDRTFEFITKSPPAAVLLKQAAGIASGSPEPHKTKVATVTPDQVRKIAETKLADLNARDLEHACRIIAGTARRMAGDIKGWRRPARRSGFPARQANTVGLESPTYGTAPGATARRGGDDQGGSSRERIGMAKQSKRYRALRDKLKVNGPVALSEAVR